jgi:dienelactone hydrolase
MRLLRFRLTTVGKGRSTFVKPALGSRMASPCATSPTRRSMAAGTRRRSSRGSQRREFVPRFFLSIGTGPPDPTSNRTQFIPDGIELAKKGAISLLIDTPWSRPEYFRERTRETDYSRSVQQVKDLRRALDILLSLPDVDPQRVAFVGHDFGAMYGALAVASDTRAKAFVFMAGTSSFSDWFLYGKPKLEGEARQKFVDALAPLDPIRHLPRLKMPILLQFANDDEHVSKARADALAAVANEPKTIRVYSAKHELNEEATQERIAWLKKELWK